ncbi:MAG TPA: ribosomal protein S18-alanine N-acetyltransferase [Pyrinomonadaceae bacterium]|nr:ribosomal protein S18-alanine N-acetyltransferase [Pyrinomonadaceae bacterium]
MKFDVISASVEDVGSIVSIQEECDLSEWTADAYVEEIACRDAITLIARLENEVAGFVTGRVIAAEGDAEIYNIGVRGRFQRAGVGSALLRTFMAKARQRHARNIWLDVRESNRTAIEFYERHGFAVTGKRVNFYRDPVEDAELMVFTVAERPC